MARQDFPGGGFVGRLGNLVGQRHGSEWYVRQYVVPHDPRTPAQIAQRNRFAQSSLAASASQLLSGGRGYWTPNNFDERQKFMGYAQRSSAEPNWPISGCWLVPPDAGTYRGVPFGVSVASNRLSVKICGGNVPMANIKCWGALCIVPVEHTKPGLINCLPFVVPLTYSGNTHLIESPVIALSAPYVMSLPTRIVGLKVAPIDKQQYNVLYAQVDAPVGSGERAFAVDTAFDQIEVCFHNTMQKIEWYEQAWARALAIPGQRSKWWEYIDMSGWGQAGPPLTLSNINYNQSTGVLSGYGIAPGASVSDDIDIDFTMGGIVRSSGQYEIYRDAISASGFNVPGGFTFSKDINQGYLSTVDFIFILVKYESRPNPGYDFAFAGQILWQA